LLVLAMKRTRKLSFVRQEAERLAALGQSPADIAKALDVNKSTVTRWFASGKLKRAEPNPLFVQAPARQSPADWARSMREEFMLSSTDEQLVTLGEAALSLSRDVTASPVVQLSASASFRAIAKQLAIATSRTAAKMPEQPKKAVNESPARVLKMTRKPQRDPRDLVR
jgi:transposase